MEERIKNVIERMKADNIKFIRLQFVDLHGIPKNVSIPCKLENMEDLLTDGILFDGSSIPGFVGIEGSDLVLKYDLIANLFYAGEEMNLNAMKVKVNDKEITVPSKQVSNDAGDNNKSYEVTLTGIAAEENVKIEFWADPALNSKGLRLDNIIIESVPGATTGVKAK